MDPDNDDLEGAFMERAFWQGIGTCFKGPLNAAQRQEVSELREQAKTVADDKESLKAFVRNCRRILRPELCAVSGSSNYSDTLLRLVCILLDDARGDLVSEPTQLRRDAVKEVMEESPLFDWSLVEKVQPGKIRDVLIAYRDGGKIAAKAQIKTGGRPLTQLRYDVKQWQDDDTKATVLEILKSLASKKLP